jgi:hypothetical protein
MLKLPLHELRRRSLSAEDHRLLPRRLPLTPLVMTVLCAPGTGGHGFWMVALLALRISRLDDGLGQRPAISRGLWVLSPSKPSPLLAVQRHSLLPGSLMPSLRLPRARSDPWRWWASGDPGVADRSGHLPHADHPCARGGTPPAPHPLIAKRHYPTGLSLPGT